MKRFPLLIATVLLSLILSGCSASEKASETFGTITSELGEAYENVINKINDTKNWFSEKFNQAEDAVNDIQNAAEEVNEAIDSIKEFTGSEDEESAETTNEET